MTLPLRITQASATAGGRAIVNGADTGKRVVTYQEVAVAAEQREYAMTGISCALHHGF